MMYKTGHTACGLFLPFLLILSPASAQQIVAGGQRFDTRQAIEDAAKQEHPRQAVEDAARKTQDESVSEHVAIEGYSPVSYFEKGIAEKGKSEFSVAYEGRTYYLSSEKQAGKFNRNPEKYKPLFDVCPYSLKLGRNVSIDPTRFKIVDGNLLLFHNSEELDALKEWNEEGDDLRQLKEARKQHKALRNKQDGRPGNADNIFDIDY